MFLINIRFFKEEEVLLYFPFSTLRLLYHDQDDSSSFFMAAGITEGPCVGLVPKN